MEIFNYKGRSYFVSVNPNYVNNATGYEVYLKETDADPVGFGFIDHNPANSENRAMIEIYREGKVVHTAMGTTLAKRGKEGLLTEIARNSYEFG